MPRSLRLVDYSDRELVHVVMDIEDESEDGWAHARDIAKRLGVRHEHPVRCVAVRLGWLRRYGVMERDEGPESRWRTARIGRRLVNGDEDAVEAVLGSLSQDDLVLAARGLASLYRGSREEAGHLMRREWKRGAELGMRPTRRRAR